MYNMMFNLRVLCLPTGRRTWRWSWNPWWSLRRSLITNRFMHANCQCLMRRTDDVTRLRDVAVKCCYIVRCKCTRSLFSQRTSATTTEKPVSTLTPPSLNRKKPKDVFSSLGGGGYGGVVVGECLSFC